MPALVEASGLIKHYEAGSNQLFRWNRSLVHAVDGVDLTIESGETLGLVGESGCGKSTLGRLLIRLIPATAGRVVFDGREITSLGPKALREARRGMQMVFQDPLGALNPRISVGETITRPLLIHGHRRNDATRGAVIRMLDLVGLPTGARHRYPHEFSGGERQRIGIARALILRPKLVVCDEPVSSLDVSVQAQIVNLLSDLQSELGLTYVFIAHDLGVVKHMAHRVAVMYLGKLVEIADKRSLYARPLHPYTQALLASMAVTHPSQRKRKAVNQRRISGDIAGAVALPSGCRFHTRCPHAMPVCHAEDPVMRQAGPDHQVACHLLPEPRYLEHS